MLWLVLCMAAGPAAAGPSAQEILAATGVEGGLIVHLGSRDGPLTAALGASDRYLVHGLARAAADVERARSRIRSVGRYGRVSVDRLRGARLPYADGIVNLVVADDLEAVPMAEVMRVLRPRGVAYIRRDGTWTKTVKPPPDGLDEWTHVLHDPSNNAVGSDTVVGPPRRIQWVGPPRYARHHERVATVSAVVSAAGRIFSIEDEGSTASAVLPAHWFLVGRDAFNGVILWKRPVARWEDHLRAFRSGPPALGRRLVAAGDRVFVTLGYGEPVAALDAATGETRRTYEGTEGTREILFLDGVLYVVRAADGARSILAIRADTGESLWRREKTAILPTTLAASGPRIFYQTADEVVCIDGKTGGDVWHAARPVGRTRPSWSAPTLVVYEDVVLSAARATPQQLRKEPARKHRASWIDSPAGELIAFSAKTGERLWSCACREGFHAAVDVLVADGLVWTGEVAFSADPGITVGRDPRTGEVKRRRPPDQAFFEVGMPHLRCYRNRATNRYLVMGRAGVEFIDLATGRAFPNHWVRGACQFGTLPSNGLLYAPSHSCACYIQAKLNGFYALAPSPLTAPAPGPASRRLARGPAYGWKGEGRAATDPAADWPTYRHDAARSGRTPAPVSTDLKPIWRTQLGGRLSSPVMAAGRVYVATVDDHTVHALRARDGKAVWRFQAGGRVDSPPTIHEGRALFGCADGWVYGLRASDGALIWRFRAAPADRRIVAYGQLESVWPVHGSVLIEGGVAYFAAGRSSYLDGGIRLFRLDPETGRMLSVTRIDSRDPKSGRQPKGTVRGFDLPGALPDILSSDGTRVYMRHTTFDLEGVVQAETARHLYSPTGFLDDTWWHRSYWIFGTRFYTGYRDWFRAGREVPAGRLLVFDEEAVWGFARKPAYYSWRTPLEYHLFASAREPAIVPSPKRNPRLPEWGQRRIRTRWSKHLPFLARAMVLAGQTLFVAGPPDLLDEDEAWRRRHDPGMRRALEDQEATLAGRRGALLWAVSRADGAVRAERRLDAPPVFDGMIAAGGRLILATMDGAVLCLGEP